MKILWTISNWKRTGPLEPSLDLARAMLGRGHAVHVAVGRAPDERPDQAEASVRARGLDLAETGARLSKHSAPLRDFVDARRLRRWVRAARPSAVVATQRSDHVLALRACASEGVPVVRLWFGAGNEAVDPRDVRALGASAGVLAFSAAAAAHLISLGVDAARVVRAAPPLDVEALRARVVSGHDVRWHYDIPQDALLVGIVARMQTHRRFEMLWDAVEAWQSAGVPAHVLAVGRGTKEDAVARDPVRDRGLGELVHFTGYLRGAAYANALAALDAQLLLVPGSDPTCRALREGMALGVPSIATRRGMLPALVNDGVTGMLIDETAEALAQAVQTLASDRGARATMGAAARSHADEHFAAPTVAAVLDEFLAGVLLR